MVRALPWFVAATMATFLGALLEVATLWIGTGMEPPADVPGAATVFAAVVLAAHGLLWFGLAAVAVILIGPLGDEIRLRTAWRWMLRCRDLNRTGQRQLSARLYAGALTLGLMTVTVLLLGRHFLTAYNNAALAAAALAVTVLATCAAHVPVFGLLVGAVNRLLQASSTPWLLRTAGWLARPAVAGAILVATSISIAMTAALWRLDAVRIIDWSTPCAALILLVSFVAVREATADGRHRIAIAAVAASGFVLGLVGYGVAAAAADDHPGVIWDLEDRGLLAAVVLPILQGPDSDGDGYRIWVGGGDCDDADAGRHPAATDQPGNGIDEDCDGEDLEPGGAFELLLLTKPASLPATAPPLPAARNLVLVTIDTLRADHVGCYGYPRDTSPNLDALARRGVRWAHAYAPASLTTKSMPSIFTGRHPSEIHRTYSVWPRFESANLTLAEILDGAGFRTAAVVSHRRFRRGYEQGFDTFESRWIPKDALEHKERKLAAAGTDVAIDYLDAHRGTGDRFFLWVHYVDPHRLYNPPPEFEKFGSDTIARYDGEVAYVDHHLGRLLATVATLPAAAATAIVVTSDHGEALGEHGMPFHGMQLWEALTHVPLIIVPPGLPAASAGKVVRRRTGLVELVPTILELLEVPYPDAGPPLRGTSFLAELLPGFERPVGVVYMDLPAGPKNRDVKALIFGDLKLHHLGGRHFRLYDLAIDPHETRNVFGADKARDAELVELYKRFRASLDEIEVSPPAAGLAETF